MSLSDQTILDYIAAHPGIGKQDIRRNTAPGASDTTIWRAIRRLVDAGKLEVTGKGRATGYTISGAAVVRSYLQTPYNQRPLKKYEMTFLDSYIPNETFYLNQTDRERMHNTGKLSDIQLPAGTYTPQILERLLVDLSWASSRMEGNTYDILETERLVHYGQEASGKDRKEALMILNHKDAIQYLVNNLETLGINRQDMCNIHALLSDGLLIDPAMSGRLRRMNVGIAHSSYSPLADRYEIEEEFNILILKASAITDPFEQSFFLLVHVPYLQAFDDINKRTSRIAANIPLLKANLAPMSFITMDDREYINGLIGIYELNNIALLREAYINAYQTSAENYKTVRAEVESPEKAAIVYREFVRNAVRRCVLKWKVFDATKVLEMLRATDIPIEDHQKITNYVAQQFDSLHAGNAIRYRLHPEDLVAIGRT